MSAPFSPPPSVDLLALAIDSTRVRIEAAPTTKARVRIFWAAAKQANNLGASDIVHDAFVALAADINLIDKNGQWTGADVRESVRRFGAEDVKHITTWALRGLNPFEQEPLQ
jgi:hypothetical protein